MQLIGAMLLQHSQQAVFKNHDANLVLYLRALPKIDNQTLKVAMSKVLLRLSHTRKQAFRHGFLKGLGAPILLFGEFRLDPAVQDYDFKPLPSRQHGSIASDWSKVGEELKTATARG